MILPPLREGESFHHHYVDEDTLYVEIRGYGRYAWRYVSTVQAYYARFDHLRDQITDLLVDLRAAARKP
jgi:hypothetical protein